MAEIFPQTLANVVNSFARPGRNISLEHRKLSYITTYLNSAVNSGLFPLYTTSRFSNDCSVLVALSSPAAAGEAFLASCHLELSKPRGNNMTKDLTIDFELP